MNTITQYLHRGTLDKQTAAVMKRLAKNKMELAIKEVAYANGDYTKEMEQDALLNEAHMFILSNDNNYTRRIMI